MHIVYFISLGGGPEAFIKNLKHTFESNNVTVSIILDHQNVEKCHAFPSFYNIFILKNGSKLPYYLWRIFGKINLLKPHLIYYIKSNKENQLFDTLLDIEKSNNVDLVEVVEGQFVNKISKRWKVVTRAHGSDWAFRNFCQDQDNSFDHLLVKWQKQQHRLSIKNFAISKHTKNLLIDKCQLYYNDIIFIPYPIPNKDFIHTRFLPTGDIPNGVPILLSIGRLETRKGTDILIKSLNHIWKNNPDVCLILLGKEGDLKIKDLRKLIPFDKQAQLIFPGFVHYSAIPSYYKSSTIYISSSKYETFGYTLLEAMASGTPIICTNRGAMGELIRNNYNGLVLNYGDHISISNAVNSLLSDNNLYDRFVNNGLKVASEYDIDTIGKVILNSYYDVIDT